MSTSVLSLPYSQSRPLILAGRLTAPIVAGAYTWDGSAFDASPRADLKAAYLYIVTSISFAADLDAANYADAIDSTYTRSPIPSFRMMQGGGASVLPDAVPVPFYFSDLGVCQAFQPATDQNRVQFSAQGRLIQTPQLVGKASVSLSVSCIVYEVSDLNWIRKFLAKTPAPPLPVGTKPTPTGREALTMDRDYRQEVFG